MRADDQTKVEGVDYPAVFAATPTAIQILSPELVIQDANDAFLAIAGGISRSALVGRHIFEVFPDNPDDGEADGVFNLRRSLERVLATGRPHTMPLQRYDLAVDGEFVERFWSPIICPVLGASGEVVALLHRVEDVTDYVRQYQQPDPSPTGSVGQELPPADGVDVFARATELRAALAVTRTLSRRVSALADVAVQLATAQTVGELVDVVIGRALGVLGAGGGAVGVCTERGTIELHTSDLLDTEARRTYRELAVDDRLPMAVAAAGVRVLLPDEASSRAHSPRMAGVIETTGLRAWASLPLQIGSQVVGSLSVGWSQPQSFDAAEVEVLDAIAAQCAQALHRIQTLQRERLAGIQARRMSETLQRSMLTAPPEPEHLRIAVRYLPAVRDSQVGGDWYDGFLTPDGATWLAIGDAAGHDRNAAATMGQLRNLMRGIAVSSGAAPAAVMADLDRAIEILAPRSLATTILARIDANENTAQTGEHTLRWCNAGHPPPILIAADGTATVLSTAPERLLGVDASVARSDHEQVLEPGATVLLYTDGLIERPRADLDDGIEWLRRAVADLAGLELEQLCTTLLGRLPDPEALADDIALLALRAHPLPATVAGRSAGSGFGAQGVGRYELPLQVDPLGTVVGEVHGERHDA